MRVSVTDRMAERLEAGLEAARRRGAAAAKLSFSRSEAIDCRFEAGRLKETSSHGHMACSVEALVEGRVGQAAGNRMDDVDGLVERAIVLSRTGRAAHFDAYPAQQPFTSVRVHSERTLGMTRGELIEAAGLVNQALKALDPDLFVQAGASRWESESVTLTSGGLRHAVRRTGWSLGGGVQRTRGTDVLMAGYGRSWGDLNEFWDPRAVSDKVIQDVRRAETTAAPPIGRTTVVVPPELAYTFLVPLFLGINGRNVAKGDSPLAGSLGRRVLGPALTIEDNPHVDYAGGAAEMDGDGVPTCRQVLLDGGVLARFLYDLDSAGLAGAEPTGNSGCMPYNVFVRPGERPSDELIADVREGLLLRSLIGFGQSNIINGDFSCNVGLGCLVRDGQVAGRVKDTMISGNLYDLLSGEVLLSSDTEHEGRFPWMVVAGVTVSTRA